jgi:hypothetical protein
MSEHTITDSSGLHLMWCPDHRCYHQPGTDLAFTEQAVIRMVYAHAKLTTRQARRYLLAIYGDIVHVPQRENGEWISVRYRWRIDGNRLHLEVPDEPMNPSRN